jgi:hypothetical protein
MKTFRNMMAGLVICSLAVLTGCRKDDIQPTDQDTSPNFSTRGGLVFVVKNQAGNAVSGATVGIALSSGELVTNSYLASRTTGSDGRADFGKMNADNYYYEVDVTINSTTYHGEGVVQVQAGVDLEQELTLQ